MNAFRGFTIPTLEATLNVVWETIKAYMPDNSPCMELLKQKNESAGRGNWFKPGEPGENTEMSTMAEEGYEATGMSVPHTSPCSDTNDSRTRNRQVFDSGVAEDGFINRQQTYQQSKGGPSMASVDFSEGEFCEGGGSKGHKIDEWQAAWNVTNAIQVR